MHLLYSHASIEVAHVPPGFLQTGMEASEGDWQYSLPAM